jgi:hypothetical protein
VGFSWRAILQSGKLDGQVAQGGTFLRSALNDAPGMLRGEAAEELVTAAAADNDDLFQSAAGVMFEPLEDSGVLGGEAVQDECGELRSCA